MRNVRFASLVALLLCIHVPTSASAQCMGCIVYPPYWYGLCQPVPMGYTQCTQWSGGVCANGGDGCSDDNDAELLPSGELVTVAAKRPATWDARKEVALLSESVGVGPHKTMWYVVRKDCRGHIRERLNQPRAVAWRGARSWGGLML